MKMVTTFMLVFTLMLNTADRAKAQQEANTRLFRAYVDNDFFNIRGEGTDDAYTGGLRVDLFYTKRHASRFVIDRLMPKLATARWMYLAGALCR